MAGSPSPLLLHSSQSFVLILELPDRSRVVRGVGGGGSGCGGVACCRVLGRCALGSGPPLRVGLFKICSSGGLSLGGGFGGVGLVCGGVVGGLVVNCIVDASIKKVFCCCYWFVAPRRAPAPPALSGSGVGVGGRASARGAPVIRWAVSAPVSVLLLCVVCCSLIFERSVDALASGADEGRGGLRYSSGSRLAGCDPRVSEWGDPAPVVGRHPCLKFIGRGG